MTSGSILDVIDRDQKVSRLVLGSSALDLYAFLQPPLTAATNIINGRSEVTSATIQPSSTNRYEYDGIGNNLRTTLNGTTNTYTANNLNQYTTIFNPGKSCYPVHDLDGNLPTNGVWSYTWDAENRMTNAASNGVPAVTSGYDPQHRRVVKTTPSGTTVFLYGGWLPVLEKVFCADGTGQMREHVWGKDLSGTRGGAGGVGGLLATRIGNAWYFPLFDTNGNVTDYINESGANVAHREYDAFGNTITKSGPMVNDFNFWFSTKYLDHETGFYYYGYRFYSPELMRWMNRDPIEERGGDNLYIFVNNDVINGLDELGLAKFRIGFYGAGGPGVWGNDVLKVEISDKSGGTMYLHSEEQKALTALLMAIEVNKDKKIDCCEKDHDIKVFGYSWGGSTAVSFARKYLHLPAEQKSKALPGGYILECDIPISVLLVLDPVTLFNPAGTVSANVDQFVNYYQQRGGYAIFREVGGSKTKDFGSWFSAKLKGTSLPSSAKNSIQIRIDTTDVSLAFSGPTFSDLPNNSIFGGDVNHDVVPWYARFFADNWLK